jgi:mono/diheme cytochrome c family protein
MPRTLRIVTTVSAAALCIAFAAAEARSKSMPHFDEFSGGHQLTQVGFQLQDPPLGGTQAPAAKAANAALAGSTIAALGAGALVIDADSGMLLRTDRNGKVIAQMDVGREASQLVIDKKKNRAFVVDRSHDQVLVVSLADDGLQKTDAIRTAAEPFGVALSPDGSTLLVTQVADQRLTAFDTGSGFEKWSLELGPEPRGVAISPDGGEALVTFLTTGVVGRVELRQADGQPKMSFVSLDPAGTQGNVNQFGGFQQAQIQPAANGTSSAAAFSLDKGKSFVRNTFAAAYVGNGVAVVPHQLSTPQLATGDFEVQSGGYGGGNGFTAPVNHRFAFLDTPDAGSSAGVRMAMAGTSLHQPRAMAYDGNSDTLYVAGYGSDDVVAIADVSQSSVHLGWQHSVVDSTGSCAPDGLAVDDDSGNVLVFCSLTRKVVRLKGDPDSNAAPTVVSYSGELAKSSHTAAELRGKKLFRQGKSPVISSFGAMACASCHAEGRADGLTWFLQGNILQTPFLSGRLVDTHPFKWDGQDPTLSASLTNTVKRLGGSGISKSDAEDLAAFVTSMPKPRTPSVEDSTAVARGKKLFESDTTGCLNCHDGAMSTDRKSHDLASDLPKVDTPSLVGLAHSAPYYHDGSATSLESLLRNNGSIHAMGRTSRLDDAQIADLVAYLETL